MITRQYDSLNVQHRSYHDPNYSLDSCNHREELLVRAALSPIMVHIKIIHTETLTAHHTPGPDGLPEVLEIRRRRLCFCSNINLFMNDQKFIFDFLSPKLSYLVIDREFRSSIADGICDTVIDSFHRFALGKGQTYLPIVCQVHTEDSDQIEVARAMRESRWETRRRSEQGNNGMVPAAAESVNMLKEGVKVEEKSNCPVCLEDVGEFASTMPCKHMFHYKCILKWLRKSHCCPICRFKLPTAIVPTSSPRS